MTLRLALTVRLPIGVATEPIVAKSPIAASVCPSMSAIVMPAPSPAPALRLAAPVVSSTVTVLAAITPTDAKPAPSTRVPSLALTGCTTPLLVIWAPMLAITLLVSVTTATEEPSETKPLTAPATPRTVTLRLRVASTFRAPSPPMPWIPTSDPT